MRYFIFLFLYFLSFPLFVDAELISGVVISAGEVQESILEGFEIETFMQEITVRTDDGLISFENDFVPLREGQRIFMDRFVDDSGEEFISLYDVDRSRVLLFLFLIFFCLVLLLNFRKGLKSLLSLFFTGIIVLMVLIPLLKAGFSPIIAGSGVAVLLLVFVMLFTHGFNRKTFVAMVGTATAIFVTVFLALVTLRFGAFTGIGTDESFAVIASGLPIDMPQLLFVGILIGMLGVLDDVAITQASVVQQLKNAGADGKTLFVNAMKVGQDHVGALVNTLVLAYTGTALPLILLTSLKNESLPALLSIEIVATEIIRALLGSVGVILTVPLTTLLAVIFLYKNSDADVPHYH